MKRLSFILVLTYLSFIIEFLLFSAFGRWGTPNLIILLIIFFNLYLGIRYGLLTAFCAGVIKDSFTTGVFGTNIFLLMSCAFLATILRRNFYRPGSRLSRIIVTAGVVTSYVLAQIVLRSMEQELNYGDVFQFVLLPEIVLTVISATFVFTALKEFAVRFQI